MVQIFEMLRSGFLLYSVIRNVKVFCPTALFSDFLVGKYLEISKFNYIKSA